MSTINLKVKQVSVKEIEQFDKVINHGIVFRNEEYANGNLVVFSNEGGNSLFVPRNTSFYVEVP